jgi:hypothetical protein
VSTKIRLLIKIPEFTHGGIRPFLERERNFPKQKEEALIRRVHVRDLLCRGIKLRPGAVLHPWPGFYSHE